MQSISQPGRTITLVVELGTGTAVVDGERLELPSKELKLLAELAARPGEAVASSELIAAVWPEAPWMTAQDLYWHISQLRRDLGGSTRARRMVRNRRGFGYLLDLPPQEVVLRDAASVTEEQPDTIWLEEDGSTESHPSSAEDIPEEAPVAGVEAQGRRFGIPRLAVTAALIAGLIAASWSAGFLLSKWRATASVDRPDQGVRQRPQERPQDPEDSQEVHQKGPARNRSRKPREGRGGDGDRGHGAPLASGVVIPTEQPEVPASVSRPAPQPRSGDRDSRADRKPPPSLPPAPTRYLYHLMNQEAGDHFVTIDGGVASEYEARGYQGGAIARVYTSPEDDTKAIATNHGTAYVFVGSSPETKPASTTVALWYSTDNDGDFFYTTSASEASQQGWSATLIGYARTLS